MAEIDDVVKVVKGLLPRGGGKRETRGERIKRMVVEAARKKFEERKEVRVILGAERSDDV